MFSDACAWRRSDEWICGGASAYSDARFDTSDFSDWANAGIIEWLLRRSSMSSSVVLILLRTKCQEFSCQSLIKQIQD